jgi:hypothetical protein
LFTINSCEAVKVIILYPPASVIKPEEVTMGPDIFAPVTRYLLKFVIPLSDIAPTDIKTLSF